MTISKKITPFLWFDKEAEEAMNFYVRIFKSSEIIAIQRYPEGATEGPMQGMGGKVLTGVFELEGQRFMAIDGGPMFRPTPALSLLIECDTQEEIDHYWSKLSAVPEAEQCGWLKDKYGFSWQVVPDMSRWFSGKDKDKNARVMQAVLSMKKMDIAALQKAYDGK